MGSGDTMILELRKRKWEVETLLVNTSVNHHWQHILLEDYGIGPFTSCGNSTSILQNHTRVPLQKGLFFIVGAWSYKYKLITVN